jgi:hypothetical protein
MNLLIDVLPEEVEIGGELVPVNSDFRSCLRTILAFEDYTLLDLEKAAVLLVNLYEEAPENTEEAIIKGLMFLNGDMSSSRQPAAGQQPMRLYSFSKDANLIYAAFQQTHGLDLQSEDLHWWRFMALFMDLGADTSFSNIIGLRRRLKTGKASKEERAMAGESPDLVYLDEPDLRTPEEITKEEEFMALIKGRKDE